MAVGAQDVGQNERIARIGFLAGDRVPFPVAGRRGRIDREDLASPGTQRGDQQPVGGLERDGYRGLGTVAVLDQEIHQQPPVSGRVVIDTRGGEHRAVLVDQGDLMVLLGPVDSAVYIHESLPFSHFPRRRRALTGHAVT
jgi:hypothetical protein